MYGLVNQGVKDLVIHLTNEETWNAICEEAGAPADYISMQYYDDKITYQLVGVVSSRLNIPSAKVLGEFGKYWVKYTAKEGYGPIMDLFGSNFKSCLKNLNQLHMRMGMSMPKLAPPSFTYNELAPDTIEVEYQSHRAGLSPMVQGLLSGLADKYNLKVDISFREENERKIFLIKILS